MNMHTVLRAEGDLRDEGAGRDAPPTRRDRASGRRHARLVELARELTTEATRQGLTKAELRRLIEEVS